MGYMHIGMGMVREVRQICEECDGQGAKIFFGRVYLAKLIFFLSYPPPTKGELFPEGSRCKTCNGKKKREEEVFVDVLVEAGTTHGQKITVAGESHRSASHRPGDVVFVVREADHDSFKRQGKDLWIERKVSITEALCGCRVSVLKKMKNVAHFPPFFFPSSSFFPLIAPPRTNSLKWCILTGDGSSLPVRAARSFALALS